MKTTHLVEVIVEDVGDEGALFLVGGVEYGGDAWNALPGHPVHLAIVAHLAETALVEDGDSAVVATPAGVTRAQTATIDVPIAVRKTGPDAYQYLHVDGDWSPSYSKSVWRAAEHIPGARAIVQAIDSGAFVDRLPTAINSVVYVEAVDSVFTVSSDDDDRPWRSARWLQGRRYHTPAQVQSYGEFRVLYDPVKREG